MKDKSTGRGFAILSIAGILSKVFSLLYIPILTNIYNSDSTYGIYVFSYQIYQFIYIVATSGIPVGISKLVSEYISKDRYKDVYKAHSIAKNISGIVGGTLAIGLFLLAGFISEASNTPEAKYAIMFLAPTIYITAIMGCYRGFFQGRGNMVPTAIVQIVEQLVNIVLSILFAYILIKKSVPLGVMGGTVGTTFGAFIALVILQKIFKETKAKDRSKIEKSVSNRRVNREIRSTFYRYTIPITITATLYNFGMYLVDSFVVKQRMLSSGFANNIANERFGFLGKYNSILSVPLTLTLALSIAVLPAISSAIARSHRKEALKKIHFANRTTLMITIPAAFGMSILSSEIFKILGTSNEFAPNLLKYGSFVLIFFALDQISGTILNSLGKFRETLMVTILGMIIKITFTFILVSNPDINVIGAVIANMIAFFITVNINYRIISKTLRMKMHVFKDGIMFMSASLVMAGTVFFIRKILTMLIGTSTISSFIVIMICGVVGVGVYAILIILFGAVKKSDLDEFPNKITSLIPEVLKSRIK